MRLGILQGRMTSSRLPGKVMAPVLGLPMIARQVERLRRSQRLDHLVLATSLEASDDPLASYAQGAGLDMVRGDLNDVLSRFGAVLDGFPQASTVVRLTADCPLTDWRVLDQVIDLLELGGSDYVNNTGPERTFPHGLDVEAMKASVLRQAVATATTAYDREHVTPLIYNAPERFKVSHLTRAPSLAHLRWTVDYPDDLAFVREVYGKLHAADPDFGTEAVAALTPNSAPLQTPGG